MWLHALSYHPNTSNSGLSTPLCLTYNFGAAAKKLVNGVEFTVRVSLSMCTALLCSVLQCTVCVELRTALCVACTALHCTVCAAAHCTALCCHALCVLRPALHCVYCAAKRTVCAVHCPPLHCAALGGKNIALRGGGGVTRKPVFPTPPPPPSAAVTGGGGSGRGRPTCRARGGGVNPTSMAQNDTHIALIILTTQMWGGEIIGGKNFFGPNSMAFGKSTSRRFYPKPHTHPK